VPAAIENYISVSTISACKDDVISPSISSSAVHFQTKPSTLPNINSLDEDLVIMGTGGTTLEEERRNFAGNQDGLEQGGLQKALQALGGSDQI